MRDRGKSNFELKPGQPFRLECRRCSAQREANFSDGRTAGMRLPGDVLALVVAAVLETARVTALVFVVPADGRAGLDARAAGLFDGAALFFTAGVMLARFCATRNSSTLSGGSFTR